MLQTILIDHLFLFCRMVVLDPNLTKILINKNEDIDLLPWDQLFERLALLYVLLYLTFRLLKTRHDKKRQKPDNKWLLFYL